MVRDIWRRRRTELLLALVVLAFTAPLGGRGGGNEPPRLALAASLVERGTVEITPYQPILGVDFAIRDGRYYSDKAPGTSVLFAPVYAAVTALTDLDLLETPDEIKFVAKLTMSSIPAAILAGLIAATLMDRSRRLGVWTATMIVAGTMLLPFGTVFFGHEMAALLGFSAYLLARSESPRRIAVAGLVASVAVAVEYPMGIVALALLVYVAVRSRPLALFFVAGAVPVAVALLAYHAAAFGNPLHTPYRYAFALQEGFSGIGASWPDPSDIVVSLVGERGMFVMTPVVLAASAGFFVLRDVSLPRSERWLLVSVVAGLSLVPSMWVDEAAGPTGGWSPGPRFATPAMPFLAMPLFAALRRRPWWVSAAGTVSIGAMVLATITDPLAPHDGVSGAAIGHWLSSAADTAFRYNLLVDGFGTLGLLLQGAVLGALGWRLLVSMRAPEAASATDDAVRAQAAWSWLFVFGIVMLIAGLVTLAVAASLD
jgi:hypothetical protein